MSTARRRRLAALLKMSGAADVETALIEPAFIHESAAREGAGTSNERLEFFGDAILGFVTARWLTMHYPNANEGELHRRRAAIVSGDACAQTAMRLGFNELVILGVGMTQSGGANNASILADAFEAYIAALYTHADLARVTAFIEKEHLAYADHDASDENHVKTVLQEFTQAHFGTTPTYFERAEGPPQDRRFISQVRLADEVLGEGIGPSKKIAQQSAAAMALAHLREKHPLPPKPPSPPPSNGRVIAMRPPRPKTKDST